jgi:hypothetical protein
MANITFAWMVECVRPYLAFDKMAISETMDEYIKFLETIHCKNNHHHHHDPSKDLNLATRAYNGVYNSLPSIWETPPQAPLEVGWGTAHFVDSCQGVMAWAGAKQRNPGQCETEIVVEEKSILWKPFYGEAKMEVKLLSELGETNEQVHPVARFRREKLKEDTGGLQGWKSRKMKGGWFEWYKGDLVLKEYVIKNSSTRVGDFPNVERLVAGGDTEATEFLKKTDKVNGISPQTNGKKH